MHRLTYHHDHFAKNSTHIVPQPPYWPDLAPRVCLFPKLKRPLRRSRFKSIEEINKIEKGVDGYTRKGLFGMYRGGKYVGISVFYREGIT